MAEIDISWMESRSLPFGRLLFLTAKSRHFTATFRVKRRFVLNYSCPKDWWKGGECNIKKFRLKIPCKDSCTLLLFLNCNDNYNSLGSKIHFVI